MERAKKIQEVVSVAAMVETLLALHRLAEVRAGDMECRGEQVVSLLRLLDPPMVMLVSVNYMVVLAGMLVLAVV